jgi:DNA-binding transcriptional LysR family regulator
VLRVTAPVTLANRYIAPLLPELAQKYPKLELDMRLSDAMVNLVDEAIDVAIRMAVPSGSPT